MEKKKISCSYALLVVILFATLCILTDYIVIDRKIKCAGGVSSESISSESFYDNFKSQIASKYDEYNYSMKYVENYFVPDGYIIRLDSNGNLYVKYSVEDSERLIANDVLSFYLINTGQDLGNTLYFINSDGTVGKASTEYGYSSLEDIEVVNKIDGFNNIVSIVEGVYGDEYSGAHGPIFIDINGNIFKDN